MSTRPVRFTGFATASGAALALDRGRVRNRAVQDGDDANYEFIYLQF
jgi:hypothetical protein